MGKKKTDREDLNLIVHLCKLGTIQVKSMKCETNIRNNQYRTSILIFVFSFFFPRSYEMKYI